MKKTASILIIVIFVLLFAFFTGFSIFGEKKDFSVNENRALQTLPNISVDNVLDGSFQKDYDSFLSDQFEFRDFWVTAKTRIMLALGKKDINGVFIGKDDYLIEKYTDSDFDDDLVKYNIDMISDFLNRTAELEVGTYVSFVPSKGTVLTNRLPKNASPYDSSYVGKSVEENLSDGVKCIDILPSLKERNGEYIYFRTDHHWTSLGAYYAYSEIGKAMGFEPLSLDSFESRNVTDSFVGSSYDKLQLGDMKDIVTAYDSGIKVSVDFHGEREKAKTLYFDEMLSEKNKYEFFLGGNYGRVDIKTNADSNKKLIVVKDSYTNAIIPFLINHYKNITMIDLRFFADDLDGLIYDDYTIDDVLVLLNTEKFMQDQNMTKIEPYDESEFLDPEEMEEQERILEELDD